MKKQWLILIPAILFLAACAHTKRPMAMATLQQTTGQTAKGTVHLEDVGDGNIEVVVEDTIAEGDKVVARCSVRGKHVGDSLGFKATGAQAEFDGITIVRVKNGKIVEAWNNFDFMKMYRQLGAI